MGRSIVDKYEYKCEVIGDPTKNVEQVGVLLNKAAEAGWRLVAITPARYGISGIFERPAIAMPVAVEVKPAVDEPILAKPPVKRTTRAKK